MELNEILRQRLELIRELEVAQAFGDFILNFYTHVRKSDNKSAWGELSKHILPPLIKTVLTVRAVDTVDWPELFRTALEDLKPKHHPSLYPMPSVVPLSDEEQVGILGEMIKTSKEQIERMEKEKEEFEAKIETSQTEDNGD